MDEMDLHRRGFISSIVGMVAWIKSQSLSPAASAIQPTREKSYLLESGGQTEFPHYNDDGKLNYDLIDYWIGRDVNGTPSRCELRSVSVRSLMGGMSIFSLIDPPAQWAAFPDFNLPVRSLVDYATVRTRGAAHD